MLAEVQEGDRDRDAFYAYHNEVTKASGITKHVSTLLTLFGNLSGTMGAPTYNYLTKDSSLQTNLIAAGAGYIGAEFLKKVAKEVAQDWKPLVFGEWVKKEIGGILSRER